MGYPGEGPTLQDQRLDAIENDLRRLINPLDDHRDMGRKLSDHVDQWRTLVKDEWAHRLVAQGLKLQVRPRQGRPQRRTRRFKMDPAMEKETQKTIHEYLQHGAIREVFDTLEDEEVCQVIAARKKDGGIRSCLNLKQLNRRLPFRHFKQEGLTTVRQLLRKDDWMVNVDLKDAYHHVQIHPEYRKYLRFQFKNRKYECICLPFGLTHAPQLFTKLIRKVLKLLRRQGIRIVHFIDDFLIAAQSLDQLRDHTEKFINLFQTLGLTIHPKKSHLRPAQHLSFLGLEWNTRTGEIHLPDKKRINLRRSAQRMTKSSTIRLRDLARLLGQLQFAGYAIPRVRLHSQQLVQTLRVHVRRKMDYQQLVKLSPPCLDELRWWVVHLRQPLHQFFLVETRPVELHGRWDASKNGWGGYARIDGRRTTASGLFTWEESQLGNNVREALAQLYGWQTIVNQHLPAQHHHELVIRAGSDNMTWVHYIRRQGGRCLHLNQPVKRLLLWLHQKGIALEAYHVPGKQNRLADRLSRRLKQQRFRQTMNPQWFHHHLLPLLQQPMLDLFGTRHQSLLPRYSQDLFSRDWDLLPAFCWGLPPPVIILRILQRLPRYKGVMYLCVPCWDAQPWFPLLWDWLVGSPILINPQRSVFSIPTNSTMIVMPLSGDVCKIKPFQSRLSLQFAEDWAEAQHSTIQHGALLPSFVEAKTIVQSQLAQLSLQHF